MNEPGGADVVVLGAGVIGLTTAITLAERGCRVLVRTAEPPESTTSAAAGALWGPWLAKPHDRALDWARHTLNVLTALAGEPDTGVRMTSGIDISTQHHQPPDWFNLLPDARPCATDELPYGYTHGVHYTAPLVDMPVHLDYLARRLRAANGTIEVNPVATLHEAAVLAPIVLNCTGLGAHRLANDNTLRPVRGQHLVTTNPGITEFTEVDTGDSPDLIAIYPHSDHLVLGGTAEPGSWEWQPSPETAEAILARCAALDARLHTVDVLGHRVGLRPTRNEVRLEEQAGPGGGRVIHNYGHGGAGVSLAWGCANDAATLTDKTG